MSSQRTAATKADTDPVRQPRAAIAPAARSAGGFWDTVRTILFAVIIAFAVRTFAFEPFNIPSGSMIPTLLVGDYLFVSKFSYGYSRHTVAFGYELFDGRLLAGMPERGDVAVFKLPRDDKTDYIKRIVGLPGDTIQMRNGVLYVNGTASEMERVEDVVISKGPGREIRAAQYLETLPGSDQPHRIIHEDMDGPLDDTPVYRVPAGHYFAMGDNRDNSLDSRVASAVGYVPEENLVGRAEYLFFSLAEGTHFLELWRWPWDVRFGRFFEPVI